MLKDNNFSGYSIVEEYNLHKKRKERRGKKAKKWLQMK
jgi:hypothetical protein